VLYLGGKGENLFKEFSAETEFCKIGPWLLGALAELFRLPKFFSGWFPFLSWSQCNDFLNIFSAKNRRKMATSSQKTSIFTNNSS
jgi:hypothetical protein